MRFLFRIVTSTAATLMAAACLSPLWRWYVEPLGVPGIGVAHAYGLTLVVSVVSVYFRVSTLVATGFSENKEDQFVLGLTTDILVVLISLVSLVLGAIVHDLFVVG